MSEEKKEEKKEVKYIYFRIVNSDGSESSDIITEERFSKMYSDFETIKEENGCRYIRAK